jgi:cyclophilin family peptidyl-prolyl cis-trans isomerase
MPKQQWSSPPAMEIDQNTQYTAVLKTSEGDITINLLTQEAPQTVNNFVFLARQGFYNGVIFHRTIKDFMIQGGDPTGSGSGGPGYQFKDEKVTRRYTSGIVAMANSGPNTNGSQFFIVHGADVGLPPSYTIFGQVTDGMPVVDRIATAPTKRGGENSSPVNPVQIQSVDIREGEAPIS